MAPLRQAFLLAVARRLEIYVRPPAVLISDAVFGVLATLLGTTLAILVVHRAAFREAIA